jgi:hypothetical protein
MFRQDNRSGFCRVDKLVAWATNKEKFQDEITPLPGIRMKGEQEKNVSFQ